MFNKKAIVFKSNSDAIRRFRLIGPNQQKGLTSYKKAKIKPSMSVNDATKAIFTQYDEVFKRLSKN